MSTTSSRSVIVIVFLAASTAVAQADVDQLFPNQRQTGIVLSNDAFLDASLRHGSALSKRASETDQRFWKAREQCWLIGKGSDASTVQTDFQAQVKTLEEAISSYKAALAENPKAEDTAAVEAKRSKVKATHDFATAA